jgi:dTDP-4-amino-4,6-dideoxygalactose transaminase
MTERRSIPFNTLKHQYEKFADEYLEAAKRVLESGWYVMGHELESFEKAFAEYTGANYCVGVASGLDALSLALRVLGIGMGDEVIVPSNTYIATVLAVTGVGATPVFVEPDAYYCVDPELIESAITSKTRALLPVHLYGQACDMIKIMRIAENHKLRVVEDCAQSHGVTFRGKHTGTFGDIGCFSFFPTKNLGAFGDAGGLVTDNEKEAAHAKMLRNYGSVEKYKNETEGVNSRLDEIQAALLSVKLRHLKKITEERRAIANFYLKNIANPDIALPLVRPESDHCWHLFVIRSDQRDVLKERLAANDIATQIHYPIPPHLSKAYSRLGYKKGDFPVAENYADTMLSLPLYNGMTQASQEAVCRVLNETF